MITKHFLLIDEILKIICSLWSIIISSIFIRRIFYFCKLFLDYWQNGCSRFDRKANARPWVHYTINLWQKAWFYNRIDWIWIYNDIFWKIRYTFRLPTCDELPPPVCAFTDVSFSYSGKKEGTNQISFFASNQNSKEQIKFKTLPNCTF